MNFLTMHSRNLMAWLARKVKNRFTRAPKNFFREGLWLPLTALCLFAAPVSAEPVKVALIVGNNRGEAEEVELLYSQSDASRLAWVLQRYGGFRAENITLLLEGTAAEAEKALISINDRIRFEMQNGNPEALLFVYYSGHADSDNLHLGRSLLSLDTLRKLVRGSAATFRVLVLDACKSGALTRVKGGRSVPAFTIDVQDRLGSEGTVLISSSASSEDAQESDLIKGSIFSHHFISSLLGAADENGDGQVSLSEAYQYTHQQTIKTTSRTWAGTQHPTYQYDSKGKGDIILTVLALDNPDKVALVFPPAGEFLVLKENQNGAVVAEVSTAVKGKRLILQPGKYFVRERKRDELREGALVLAAGQEMVLSTEDFERIRYARLVRKGGAERSISHGPVAFYRFRGEILSGLGPMHQFGVGYPITFKYLTLNTRLSFGRSFGQNQILQSTTDELGLMFESTYTLDWSKISFAVGLELGLSYFHQTFETEGSAPDRNSMSFVFGGIASVSCWLWEGFYLQFSVEAVSYLLETIDGREGNESETPLTYVLGVSLGKNF